jgi:hypothetical protein
MGRFDGPLTVTKVKGGRWKVAESFRYYISENEFVDVPQGFETDFASVPRPFWIIFPPDGQYSQAAVLHDYLYWSRIYSRKKSDDTFLGGMKDLNVPLPKRRAMWRAVRSFGWIPWKFGKRLKK